MQKNIGFTRIAISFLIAWSLNHPALIYGSCATGNAVPPFLSTGSKPNLLLMIDNSASMYDLAYVQSREEGYCYDGTHTDDGGNLVESYAAANPYAGYFDEGSWFAYNFTTARFETKTTAEAQTICSGASYSNSNTVCVAIDETASPKTVTAFAASGNFLNWATASKLDVQKKILTGGKYEATASRLALESRGCLGRRYVKKIAVNKSGGGTYYLTLGVRPPSAAEKIDDTDDTTRIEIFEISAAGFDYDACRQALDELNSESPNLGQLKGYVEACMGYGGGNVSDSMSAFNHALQECWYYNKHGEFQPGSGTVSSMKNDCERLYDDGIDPAMITPDDRGYVCYGVYGPQPPDGYVGRCWEPENTGEDLTCEPIECSLDDPPLGTAEICEDGVVKYCSGNYNANKNTCNKPWLVKQDCDGGGTLGAPGWTDDDGDGGDACVEEAIQDYCGTLEIPQVIDPSDAADDTGNIWNAPAVLIDSGVLSQLNEPLTVLKGHIARAAAPTGLIQQYAAKIRMGAMIFNDKGSLSECSQTDPSILYECTDPANRDGGRIISYIDQSAGHTDSLIAAVNAIKATSWTPLAEALFNAIGYYTQTNTMRLDNADFLMDASHPDPVQAWCQNNNILIVTDGASTADLNPTVSDFAANATRHDGDSDISSCGTLDGSTLLDDLTHYGWRGTDIFGIGRNSQNIRTHVVIAGTARAAGTGECDPATLLEDAAINGGTAVYQANSLNELGDKLEAAFASIRAGAAAGSAAAVIAASRGGQGAIYQASFWPRMEITNADPVEWIGEVRALHIDDYGNMYEDTNGDRTLDPADKRVIFYYDEQARQNKACVDPSDPTVICSGTSKHVNEIHYLWSGNRWLAEIPDSEVVLNRDAASDYISNDKKRYIFTWNDLNNDGSVADSEMLEFVSQDWAALSISVGANRGPVPMDFGAATPDEVNLIVNWIRGLDQAGLRTRQLPYDIDLDGTPETITWRLGDVIHSTPVAVSKPAEAYHFIYRDQSYGAFAARYNRRRHVIYFGGNDGMLHAVNGGFYNESQKKFCLTSDCSDETTAPALGAELWAYVPYNLLPHLKCLTDPNYNHKYFVDLKPRIFDAQIFEDDSATTNIHPGGWGTILVAGMRLGGARIDANTIDADGNSSPDYAADTRRFTSAYIIFDVTDPEQKPILLGELTDVTSASQVDLGFTTAMPTVIPMKTGAHSSEWYLALGSGPTTLDGRSDRQASIAVFPLKKLLESPRAALRIPAAAPTGLNEAGRFVLDANSFVSDLITVDYDLVADYRADAVYFGTVAGTWGNWGGKLYRLVTHKADENGDEVASKPSEWSDLLSFPLTNPLPLIDAGRPVTAAPAIAWDGKYRWVYFGTGRFFDAGDKTDSSSNAQETYYGIKEPQDCDGNLTWQTVGKNPSTVSTTPGERGLLRVDQILVAEARTMAGSALSCAGGGDTCLPVTDGSRVDTFGALVSYIVGQGCEFGVPTGIDGWYKELNDARERNLGQATVLGGLLSFTTYQPWEDVCLPEGLAFLYGVYYQTGTAWHESVFVSSSNGGVSDGDVMDRLAVGRGMALTPNLHVGKQTGSKAFVQTSTGAIVEIPQPNLPVRRSKSAKTRWDEIKN